MGSGTPGEERSCPVCGARLPAAPKFCPECGTPIAPAARDSRRTVTLLFTDVTGSTALGERLDPEAYRALMGRYFVVARQAVEAHGGTVEKFVGDAVLAVFGLPEVHEDDALRAVRAAHDLRGAVSELGAEVLADHGIGFAIRTGVNTGGVVTGPARAGGSFATGDAVNTAARLEQAAGDGDILLGATTYALVRDAVEVEAIEPIAAHGKTDPVPAYRLLAVLDTAYGRRRHADTALVGRVRESQALEAALERTLTSGRSQLVTVLGPPGIGKSRLVSEFLSGVGDRAAVASGRCVSYGQGIAYWPLVQALRHALRLTGTESDEITRHALEEAVGEAPDRDSVVALLLPLLGKTGTPGSQDQTAWCVRRLVEQLASRRPLVLSVDDLHWAEPTLLELLERVRDEVSDLPILLLCQARPELLDEHPDWGSGALDSVTFGLDPLDGADVEASLAGLLGSQVPAGLARTVADRSGGNPLFVEEIVAHLTEAGVLEPAADDGWRVVGELDRAELPPTVSALLAARLDRLPQDEHDLLERVSVVGLEFTTADAALLTGREDARGVERLLVSLTRRDLVRRVRSVRGDEWGFKHILVRDAAYDALAKAERADLHERFADGLTEVERPDAPDELLGFRAHHLEQAALYRRELGSRGAEVEALVTRAAEVLMSAAEQARDDDRPMDHGAYPNRALRLEPRSSAVRRRILASLLDFYLDADQMDQLAQTLDEFETQLDDTADDRDRALLRTMRLCRELVTGTAVDPARVRSAAQELASLGRTAGDTAAVVRGLKVACLCSQTLGLWRDARSTSEEIIRVGSPTDAREASGWELVALLFGEGTFRQCRELFRREVERYGWSDLRGWQELVTEARIAAADGSPDAGSAIAAAVARGEELHAAGKVHDATGPFLIEVFALARDLDGAIAYAQRVNDGLWDSGAFGIASTYGLQQAMLMLERGDPSAAVLPLVERAARHTSPYDTASVSLLSACRAVLAAQAGDHVGAARLVDEALRVSDATDELWSQADLRRRSSVVARARGDSDWERRLLLEAQERYRRKEIRSYDPEISARLAELDETERS
jgi:class 3 adenylate cyclase